MKSFLSLCRSMLILSMTLAATTARAAIEIPLATVFSGSLPASGSAPWLAATFEQGTGGAVLFTLQTAHLTNPENVRSFYFNFDDSLNVEYLTFQLLSGGNYTAPSIHLDENAFKADGDGRYDIRLDFATGGNLNRTFNQGDSLTYQLSYPGGISPSDFVFFSQDAGGHGPFLAAAHVQNTPYGSAWIGALVAVPEASNVIAGGALALLSLIALMDRMRRLNRVSPG